jgi:hypothetical protein
MRNLLDRFPRALPALAIMFFAACASGGSSDTATTPSAGAAQPAAGITLRVINSHSSGDDMRIFLQPETGAQKQIGNVASAGTINVPFTDARGRYRFLAERPNGSMVTSPYFNAQNDGVYVWDMALGRVDRRDR